MPDDSSDAPEDVRLLDIPSYLPWSRGKLHQGVPEAIIAHLDATCMWLRPSELNTVTPDDFEEMLDNLKASMDQGVKE